jgi:DNA-directed RNA polymerase subunit RPC12/RpoP
MIKKLKQLLFGECQNTHYFVCPLCGFTNTFSYTIAVKKHHPFNKYDLGFDGRALYFECKNCRSHISLHIRAEILSASEEIRER